MNEAEESDKQGVFHVLGMYCKLFNYWVNIYRTSAIFENILGYNPDLASELVSKTKFLSWLLDRLQSKVHDENRGYASELLSILLQNNVDNRVRFGKEDGVELLLKILSVRRIDLLYSRDYSCISIGSNTDGRILWTPTRLSLWKTCLTRYAQS